MPATIYGTPTGGLSWSGSSIAVSVPAALSGYTQTVVLVIHEAGGDLPTVTAPSGWTLRQTISPRVLFYTRKVSADTDAGTQTWTLSASREWSWGAWVTTEDYSTHTHTALNSWGTTWTAPTVTVPTVSGTDALHVSVALAMQFSRDLVTAPAGYTAMSGLITGSDADSYVCVLAGYKSVGTGATGATDWVVGTDGATSAGLSIVYASVVGGSTFTISGGGQLSLDGPSGGGGGSFLPKSRFSFPSFSL
jgi:hypothetical protein